MRTLLVALALLFFGHAQAQNLPGNPASGSFYVGVTGGPPAFTNNPTLAGSLTINPTANSTNPGFVIVQTSPTSGSTANGPINYNVISVVNTYNSTAAGSANGASNNNITGLHVYYQTGGPNLGSSQQIALYGQMNETIAASTGNDMIGTVGFAYGNVSSGGGILTGVVGEVQCDSGCVRARTSGAELDSGFTGTGSGNYRNSLVLGNIGVSQASTLDAAVIVTNYGTAPGAFNKLFAFSSNYSGGPTTILSTSADLFWWEQNTTIANVFNAENVTVSGSILKFPNMILTGAGVAGFGTGTAAGPPAIIQATCASCGSSYLNANTNAAGATNLDGFEAISADGNNAIAAYVFEPLATGTTFGQANGNWAQFKTFGSENNGLLLGTGTAKPIIFGTNNTAEGIINGGFEIGAPTGGAKGVGTMNLAGAAYANGTIGASCTLNAPAHLTVVGGIVTLCN